MEKQTKGNEAKAAQAAAEQQMEINTLLQMIESVTKTDWQKFELEDNGFSLKLERGGTANAFVPVQAPVVLEEQPALPSGSHDICSPLVGIFRDLQTPVKVGQVCEKGQIIFLIEAMKLMNEVSMPEDGEITYVALDDSDSVEYGQIVMQYNPI